MADEDDIVPPNDFVTFPQVILQVRIVVFRHIRQMHRICYIHSYITFVVFIVVSFVSFTSIASIVSIVSTMIMVCIPTCM